MAKNFVKLIGLWACSIILTACVSQTESSSFDKKQAAKARVELAIGYLQQHNLPQAKQNLDKAQQYAPHYYLVYSAFAYFYQLEGNIEQAKQAYQKSLSLDNKQGDVHNNYGAFLCGLGEFDAAYQQLEQALVSPHYYQQADSYENLILCSLSAKQPDQAKVYLQSLQKIDPKRAMKFQGLK